jgi:hypothetical protein
LELNQKHQGLNEKYQRLSENHQSLNQKHQNLNEKYQQLASLHNVNIEDPDESDSPPTKKQKIDIEKDDEKSMDPLKLPEPAANKILKYLSGKELVNSMLVSKSWRDFIKVRGSLLDKVIFKPKYKECVCEYPPVEETFSEENKRHYRHMKATLWLYKEYSRTLCPITIHASTLRTLTVARDCAESWYLWQPQLVLQPCIFPKLWMLSYDLSFSLCNLSEFSFPMLTHLRLSDESNFSPIPISPIVKFISSLPRLKVFETSLNMDPSYDMGMSALKISEEIKLPKIKAMIITSIFTYYASDFVKLFQSTLERLWITFRTNIEQLNELLQELKVLKLLAIRLFYVNEYEEVTFVRNDSIEILQIKEACSLKGNIQQHLESLLLALPSLKEFHLFQTTSENTFVTTITVDLLKFIARYMRHLKKLVCKQIADELQQAYQEIQDNPHLYVNTTFEFVTVDEETFDKSFSLI